MSNYFIIPGLNNSGEYHWQTLFERSGKNFHRINQHEWDAPSCTDWVTGLDNALKHENLADVVLIGHSLGCITIAHWAGRFNKHIKGALLVAPSDIDAPAYTFPATGFAPIPLKELPFKSVVVTSSNDPWVSLERAKYFASAWNSDFVNIGNAGHINAAAGFGEWKFGFNLLKTYFE